MKRGGPCLGAASLCHFFATCPLHKSPRLSHPDDGGDGSQLFGQLAVHGTGRVQHGVGHILFALVHHVFDVQARLGGQGGDLADQMVIRLLLR